LRAGFRRNKLALRVLLMLVGQYYLSQKPQVTAVPKYTFFN
jgi:hypothetical protein